MTKHRVFWAQEVVRYTVEKIGSEEETGEERQGVLFTLKRVLNLRVGVTKSQRLLRLEW